MPSRVLWDVFSTGSTNPTQAFNVGNQPNRFAVVFATVGDGRSFSAASVGGENLPELDYEPNGLNNADYALYGGPITVTDTQNVVVNSSSFGGTKSVRILVVEGVASIRDALIAFATSNSPTATLTTQADDLCIITGGDGGFGSTFTPASPATAFNASAGRINAEEVAAGTSTTVNGTCSSSVNWSIGAIAFAPAASPPPGDLLPRHQQILQAAGRASYY